MICCCLVSHFLASHIEFTSILRFRLRRKHWGWWFSAVILRRGVKLRGIMQSVRYCSSTECYTVEFYKFIVMTSGCFKKKTKFRYENLRKSAAKLENASVCLPWEGLDSWFSIPVVLIGRGTAGWPQSWLQAVPVCLPGRGTAGWPQSWLQAVPVYLPGRGTAGWPQSWLQAGRCFSRAALGSGSKNNVYNMYASLKCIHIPYEDLKL